MATQLSFTTQFDAQTSLAVAVAPGISRVTAPNAGPYTFTGTNTYLVGHAELALIDPGPRSAQHLAALRAAIGGRKVTAVILTHTHKDHCALVPELLRALGGPPLWFGGRHRPSRPARLFEAIETLISSHLSLVPDRILNEDERILNGGVTLRVVRTPGHCANHLAFGVEGTDMLFSGDHVMGWSSTLIAVPDGSLADYFASLEKLIALPYATYLPGHGGPIADGRAHARALLDHRQARNRQIVAAVEAGARTLGDLLAAVYPGLAGALRPAARMTLTAHAEYLADAGALRLWRGLGGLRVAPLDGPSNAGDGNRQGR